MSTLIDAHLHSFHDAKSLIFDIYSKEDRKDAGRFAVMIYEIWKNMNDLIWHNEFEEAPKLGWLDFHNWYEWFMAQRVQDTENGQQYSTNWNPPTVGWLKCNVDAAFNKNRGTTNRGWCVRDNLWNFIISSVA